MIATVVGLAATVGKHATHIALNTVGQITDALTPFLGTSGGKTLVGIGMFGAALIAAIVSSLVDAWRLAEVFDWPHTRNDRPDRATAKFYVTYALAHILGAVLVLACVDLVGLTVDVKVMNALFLPIVLGFLLALEARAVPCHPNGACAAPQAPHLDALRSRHRFGLCVIPSAPHLT